MQFRITTAGAAALAAANGAVSLDNYKLGSSVSYIPQPNDINIHGSMVFTGTPSDPIAVNANVVRYTLYLDYTVGPFTFGEIGLFLTDGTLFALGAASAPIQKTNISQNIWANAIRVDIFLSMVGTSYDMWLELSESDNRFRASVLDSVDNLPSPRNAIPNMYIVTSAASNQPSFQAYTDRSGLWHFDGYKFSTSYATPIKIIGATNTSVTVDLGDYSEDYNPNYFGKTILQFSTGVNYGTVRYVKTATKSGQTMVLAFNTPMAVRPSINDQFILFCRDPLSSTSFDIPVATNQQLGLIRVGTGLDVTPAGILSISDDVTINGVETINGKTGPTVNLSAADIPNSVRTVNGVSPNPQGNVNIGQSTYTLPPSSATTLGGVKIPSNSGLTIDSLGNLTVDSVPVSSVNNKVGDVVIEGLIGAKLIGASQNMDSMKTPGLFVSTATTTTSLINKPLGLTGAAIIEVLPLYAEGQSNATSDFVHRITSSTAVFTRMSTNPLWSSWIRMDNDVDSLPFFKESVTSLGNTTINNLGPNDTGMYYQSNPAYATTANGYPLNGVGGCLTNFRSVNGSQHLFITNTNRVYSKTLTGSWTGNGPWGAWVELNSWGQISGKPTTFAPSAHTHTIAEVTGLQDELDELDSRFTQGPYFRIEDTIEIIDDSFLGTSMTDRGTLFAPLTFDNTAGKGLINAEARITVDQGIAKDWILAVYQGPTLLFKSPINFGDYTVGQTFTLSMTGFANLPANVELTFEVWGSQAEFVGGQAEVEVTASINKPATI